MRVLRCAALLVLLVGTGGGGRAVSAANDTGVAIPPPLPQDTPAPPGGGGGTAAMVTRRSGLRFFDLTAGQGESPVAGEIVTVHYVASYAGQGQVITTEHYDGTLFDSTRDVADHRAPFTFTLGSNRVTAGMNEAVLSMHVGGRRIAIVPPYLGYGRLKIGIVPSNSTLIYDLELLEVRGLAPRPAPFQGDSDYYDGGYDYSDGTEDSNGSPGEDIDPDAMFNNDDAKEDQLYLDSVQEMLRNVTQRLDSALHAPSGTVATGATWVVEALAILSILSCVYVGGHWLYSRKRQHKQFQRLRQDYLDSEHGGELELEDI